MRTERSLEIAVGQEDFDWPAERADTQAKRREAGVTHCGNLRFLQSQSVCFPHVGVTLQHKHGDHALSGHNNDIRVSHRAMDYGRSQIHWDEVKLFH